MLIRSATVEECYSGESACVVCALQSSSDPGHCGIVYPWIVMLPGSCMGKKESEIKAICGLAGNSA